MVEDEHLVAEHSEAVEVIRTLMMGDGDDRRLEMGHMRLEGDGDFVAKATLDAGADGAEEPCGGGRCREADSSDADEASLVLEHALAEQLKPQRQQGIWEDR